MEDSARNTIQGVELENLKIREEIHKKNHKLERRDEEIKKMREEASEK